MACRLPYHPEGECIRRYALLSHPLWRSTDGNVDLPVESANMRPANLKRVAVRRRLLFFGLTFSSAILASYLMLDILQANGLTFSERLALVLFFTLFTWIAGAFWTAIAGFIIRLTGRPRAFMHPD